MSANDFLAADDDERRSADEGVLALDLRKHEVCWVLPEGAVMSGSLDCPGGALIQGRFEGVIRCRKGSLIIAAGAYFSGKAEAQQVYIEGSVQNGAKGETSAIKGHLLVAVSERATGRADLISRAFALHTRMFAGRLTTIE